MRQTAVERMCDAMCHRGPDDGGVFSSATATLGMRRLAIFDPVNGHQPMESENGRFNIVFNGAIYNFRELRAELASYFICSDLILAHDPGQHASYIGSWIDTLRRDHNELFRAAKEAEQICNYVMQFACERHPNHEVEEELVC